MGKTLKYVKEFDFGPEKTYVKGYCRGGPMQKAAGGVMKKAVGGAVAAPASRQMSPTPAPNTSPLNAVAARQVPAPQGPTDAQRAQMAERYKAAGLDKRRGPLPQPASVTRRAAASDSAGGGAFRADAPQAHLNKMAAIEQNQNSQQRRGQPDPMAQKQVGAQSQMALQARALQAQNAARPAMKRGGPVSQAKVARTMSEFKAGQLHSGSKSGPVVKSRGQAVAIAMNQARRKK